MLDFLNENWLFIALATALLLAVYVILVGLVLLVVSVCKPLLVHKSLSRIRGWFGLPTP